MRFRMERLLSNEEIVGSFRLTALGVGHDMRAHLFKSPLI